MPRRHLSASCHLHVRRPHLPCTRQKLFFGKTCSSETQKLHHPPVLPKNSELCFLNIRFLFHSCTTHEDGRWANTGMAKLSAALRICIAVNSCTCPFRLTTRHARSDTARAAAPVRPAPCCSTPIDRSSQPASRRRRQLTAAGRATDPLRRPRRAVRSLSAQHNGRVCTARRLHPSTATGARKFTDPRTSSGGLRAAIP